MPIHLVQDFNVEVDSTELLKRYLELSLPTVLDCVNEIAIKVLDNNDKYKTLNYPSKISEEKNVLPILTIEGWYEFKDDKLKSILNENSLWKLFKGEASEQDAIEFILTFLEENRVNLTSNFLNECGSGYNNDFNVYDGSIGVGYKLISNNTFPNSLSLLNTHIYYGK